jgi:HD-GYP domain-containing protein (c-di-GMP phosphodiesterase class II)
MNKSNKNNMLINTLGRQRMLTQMMAKDVGKVYDLKPSVKDFSQINNSTDNLKYNLLETTDELTSAINEYDNYFSTIKQGYIVSEGRLISFKGAVSGMDNTLKEHEMIWNNFKNAVNVVLKEESNSSDYLKAISFISDNNKKLLSYSDLITSEVLDYNNNRNLIIYYSVIAMSILLLVFLGVFIRKAYKDLFVPISQLSSGAAELGLTIVQDEKESNDESPVFTEVKTVFSQLNSLLALMENLNRNIPFKDILEYIFNTFSEYIPYTYIGVALIDEDRKTITGSYAVTGQHHRELPAKMLGGKVLIKETSLHCIIETGEERIINDLEEYVKGKPVKGYNNILIEEGIRASITFPLKSNDEVIGIIFFSSNIKDVYKEEHIRFLKTLANSIALSLEKDIFNDELIISSSLALAKLTEERDNETGEHLNRMKIYSRMIAEFLSREEKYKNLIDINYISDIERFAPLHDVGKVAIRDEILLKPGKLTEEEFEIMKTHTAYGAKVLRKSEENLNKKGRSIYRTAIEIAEGHHEKWDGSGYPYGRRGEEIPLSARIVAIADVFDALTSKRPYKKAFSFEDSINIIKEGSGKHFDPYLVKVFFKNLEKIKQRYKEFTNMELE